MRALLLAFVLFPVSLLAVTVSVGVNPSHCGQGNGSALATANGGLPPYSYSWDNGGSGPFISGLVPGSYVVTVTDGLGNTAQATAVVTDIPNLTSPIPSFWQSDCDFNCTGIATIYEADLGGTAPYNYAWPFVQVGGVVTSFMGVCASPASTVEVTDATGCPGTITLYVTGITSQPVLVSDISPACGGQANGSFMATSPWGGFGEFRVYNGTFDQIMDNSFTGGTISGIPAGTYDVAGWNSTLMTPMYCSQPAQVTIPTLTPPCGSVSGDIHHDADQDCVYNGSDLKLPYKVLTIQPGPVYSITNGNGHYQHALNFGAFTIQQALTQEEQLCPATAQVPFTIDAITTDVVVNMADSSIVPHDVSVYVGSTSARPGFPTQAWMEVRNNSAYPSGNVTVTLNYDPLLANPIPALAQWSFASIGPYGNVDLYFHADVPANINLLGTVMNYTATVTNSASELNTANNTASQDRTITGSYDPNDKQGTTSSALSPSQYFLAQDEWIDYTVRFQNTGTAAAETVTIRDVIDDDLFIPSLEILGASHTFTPSFSTGRELVFTFADINLPDSTTDLPGSQGFISYRIKPNNDIIAGDVLENTAGIYFDFNPPIITNTTSHVVDFSTRVQAQEQEQWRLLPNPANDVLNVILPEGSDGAFQLLAVDGRMMNVPVTRRSSGWQLDVRSLTSGVYIIRTSSGVARFFKN